MSCFDNAHTNHASIVTLIGGGAGQRGLTDIEAFVIFQSLFTLSA